MKPPEPQASPRYRALLQLLQTADIIWNASQAFFAHWNLGPSQFNVLNLLRLHPRGLSQTELSRELIMHRSNLTGLVDRLEKRGLVQRQDVAADRRAYRVVLTHAGTRMLNEILPRYYADAERLCERLSSRRANQLIAELQQVAERAQRIATEAEDHTHGNP
jgi:MarR family 2-MHQ and catechol resistance regulon transcriptional repressor